MDRFESAEQVYREIGKRPRYYCSGPFIGIGGYWSDRMDAENERIALLSYDPEEPIEIGEAWLTDAEYDALPEFQGY